MRPFVEVLPREEYERAIHALDEDGPVLASH
jgi:hypothetical protein